jgi:hypothetical protein
MPITVATPRARGEHLSVSGSVVTSFIRISWCYNRFTNSKPWLSAAYASLDAQPWARLIRLAPSVGLWWPRITIYSGRGASLIHRKCGTCRFFEEGGIAASGWCRHPDRQDLQHMVLVRKTELACRDGWDHDLWEPKDDEHEEAISAPMHAGARSGSGHVQRDSPVNNGRETRNVDTVVSLEHDRSNRRSEGLESEASDPHAVSDAVEQKDDPHSDVRSRKGLRAWSS